MTQDEFKKAIDGMTDDEVIQFFLKSYEKKMDSRNDEDYEIDREQLGYLLAIIEFFKNFEEKKNIKVHDVDLVPHEKMGCFEITFDRLDLAWEEVPKMCHEMCRATGLTIETGKDGKIHMSGFVPDVFRLKK